MVWWHITEEKMSVTLSFTHLSVSDVIYMQVCICGCVCACLSVCAWVGVRLDGHGRQLELHCSSSLAVINRHVSFPMVPSGCRRESSPWRARRVGTSTPSLLTLCHMQECPVYVSLRYFCTWAHLYRRWGHTGIFNWEVFNFQLTEIFQLCFPYNLWARQ